MKFTTSFLLGAVSAYKLDQGFDMDQEFVQYLADFGKTYGTVEEF